MKEKTWRRALTDDEKDEVITRLRVLWRAHPSLRLGQLISNVYRERAVLCNAEDYDLIAELEAAYTQQ